MVSRLPLSVREQPKSSAKFLGALKPGTVVELSCKKHGQNVDGNDLWYLLATRPGYVAARYVENLSPVPLCR
ncbi:SH3 domain-containing protein [Streptomyces sp. NPDC002537]